MMNNELILFGISILYGLFYGFIYAILLINRENIKHLKITEWIEDFFFFLFLTISTIHLIMVKNEGIFRGYIIFAMVFGITIYFQTLHKILRPIQIFIIDSLKELIKFICLILKYILDFIKKIYVKLFKTRNKTKKEKVKQEDKQKCKHKNKRVKKYKTKKIKNLRNEIARNNK